MGTSGGRARGASAVELVDERVDLSLVGRVIGGKADALSPPMTSNGPVSDAPVVMRR